MAFVAAPVRRRRRDERGRGLLLLASPSPSLWMLWHLKGGHCSAYVATTERQLVIIVMVVVDVVVVISVRVLKVKLMASHRRLSTAAALLGVRSMDMWSWSTTYYGRVCVTANPLLQHVWFDGAVAVAATDAVAAAAAAGNRDLCSAAAPGAAVAATVPRARRAAPVGRVRQRPCILW